MANDERSSRIREAAARLAREIDQARVEFLQAEDALGALEDREQRRAIRDAAIDPRTTTD